ncbi:hypothetical protein ASD65_08745 [Microbacterium sp. Root61]|uniref:hypothetical protein n=1 Tax=Microbacterium sp. Root61 TaxID=1736570 RepID=UPI0006F693E5|nr:hypothetical protein [Microbacterium sp. Root61]KRA24498.1 hypothetical protein ASD65_08745 [Microbacterium sp. Root61]
MNGESNGRESEDAPATQDLEEPSTEKEVGQEPRAATPEEPQQPQEPEPSHEAVGIGVIGEPMTESGDPSADDESR